METEGILASLPHNPHYLQRYIRLVRCWAVQDIPNDVYVERHHICPKSLFPEYSDGRRHPWNLLKLTARQHFIAHWLLWKAFRNRSMAWAFRSMFMENAKHDRDYRKSGRLYERVRIETSPKGIAKSPEHRAKMSLAAKGRRASEIARQKMSEAQRNRSPEHRAKIGLKHRGKNISSEMRQTLSDKLSGSGNPRALEWIVHFEDGRPPEHVTALKSWCKERGFKYTTIYMRALREETIFRDGMRFEKAS
jgi:hypothetical protein